MCTPLGDKKYAVMHNTFFTSIFLKPAPCWLATHYFYITQEEYRKSNMFNMVCRVHWELFDSQLADKYSQFHYVAKECVFVHGTLGRQRKSMSDITRPNLSPSGSLKLYIRVYNQTYSYLHVYNFVDVKEWAISFQCIFLCLDHVTHSLYYVLFSPSTHFCIYLKNRNDMNICTV